MTRGLLTKALERSLDVARDEDETPPTALRPLLKFRKLPRTALGTVAMAVHGDADFRRRVIDVVDERDIGRMALLWLQQDPGWREQLAAYLEDDPRPAAAEDTKALQRRLTGAESAAARANEQSALLKAEVARQTERVDSVRGELRAMQRERDASRKQAAALRAELDGLRGAQTKLEQTMARRDDDRRRLRDRVRELEEKALGPISAKENRELQRLARAVAASARAAAADADALDRELGERLSREPKPTATAGRLARRRPARMPSGILDDSVAGAEHLVSRPGAVLLVDGYNATLSSWPELTLEHQRDRLLALVNDLTARIVGLEAHLIFDGVDHVASPSRRRRSLVHVQFSPADVEADDVVLAMVDELPVDKVVIVASNDRRVRDAAREGGANVISVHQLLALVR
ncbi:MAG TPA: NYN domain-containing protein [Acidimicrobiales bacterium]|nr:NYN domain-containing protein [Acidimicrobiales bacterium]